MKGRGDALILFARVPLPGRVKTRLTPPLTAEECLSLHRAMVVDAAGLLRQAAAQLSCSLEVCFSERLPDGDELGRRLQDAGIGPDGGPNRGPRAELNIGLQRGDDLGERLVHAFQDRFQQGARRVVIIGSDSPTLTTKVLAHAFEALTRKEMVFGPAEDGGYLLAGSTKLHGRPFQGISWGTEKVLGQTVKKMRKLRIPYELLRTGHDLDTHEDLLRTYRELQHLEAVGAPHAGETLTCLRILTSAHPEWDLHP